MKQHIDILLCKMYWIIQRIVKVHYSKTQETTVMHGHVYTKLDVRFLLYESYEFLGNSFFLGVILIKSLIACPLLQTRCMSSRHWCHLQCTRVCARQKQWTNAFTLQVLNKIIMKTFRNNNIHSVFETAYMCTETSITV